MHARVTRTRIAPEKVDEAVEWFEQTALPQADTMAGFSGALALYNREDGAGLTLTFWESAEALDASASAATGIRSEGETAIDFEIVSVERYEVTTHRL